MRDGNKVLMLLHACTHSGGLGELFALSLFPPSSLLFFRKSAAGSLHFLLVSLLLGDDVAARFLPLVACTATE